MSKVIIFLSSNADKVDEIIYEGSKEHLPQAIATAKDCKTQTSVYMLLNSIKKDPLYSPTTVEFRHKHCKDDPNHSGGNPYHGDSIEAMIQFVNSVIEKKHEEKKQSIFKRFF